ncbi:MAG: glutathione S-transferase family protein, partial [Myxococcales bacterium]|nr:glutathione S-transferase family protein [Myxococcales bacterium]
MGQLVDGVWHNDWYDTKSTGGRFARTDAKIRRQIGDVELPAEAGRYHLYVSLACPWAHRTLIMRELKGLTAMIDISVVNLLMAENGWTFDPAPGVV